MDLVEYENELKQFRFRKILRAFQSTDVRKWNSSM